MPNNNEALPQADHDKILNERVLRRADLTGATSVEQPRAIILAGQPGSGKGGLKERTIIELNENVVAIDADELRSYHPKLGELQNDHPYRWSVKTDVDAGLWARELSASAMDGRKNIIIDTTLGNGDGAVKLVDLLRKQGYEVEIRAVAAHRLESELGVNRRFALRLDDEGAGRYVTEDYRAQVYRDLPENLNKVQAETGTPIRIFNREGVELYDSRTSPLQPGAALEEAREARLRDPKITRALSEGWREQQGWHRELPESLPRNPKIEPGTAQNLLTERAELRVVESIQRGADDAVHADFGTRVRPTVMKGLGIAGIALSLYDAADTGLAVRGHYQQGNATAAESAMIHFGGRTVGGFAGAGAGVVGAAAVGWETGPGVLVFMAVGGIGGAVAGDKFAEWTDNRRIYNQDDRQGNTWTYDPDRPDLSWQRKADIDARDDGIDNPSRGFMRASPAMASELNYQSTSTSVELILGSPPVPRDPFVIPATQGDTPSFSRADWTRDADSGQWQREVVLGFVERGMSPKRLEVADPQRAAELDRSSAEIVLQNSANSPAAIAARYETVYSQNNWSTFGAMPDAVSKARTDIDSLMASDGNFYRRQNDGEWISKGTIYDSTASGALRAELDTTREVLQATLPPPQTLQALKPMTADERIRDTLQGAYANAGVTPSAELLDAGVAAVKQTHSTHSLDSSTTALQLQPGLDGRYGVESSIASLRLDADGTYRIMAVTAAPDIQRGAQEQTPLPTPQSTPSRPKTEDVHGQTPDTTTSNKSAQFNHPGNSDHPLHSVFRQATAHIERQDEKLGRTPDEKSERLALAVSSLAANNGISRIDHMVFSAEDKARGMKAGENVIIVQGALHDPNHDRAHMKTEVAINMPIEQSLKQMDAIHQQQREQAQAIAMQRTHTPDQSSPVQRMSQMG